MAVINLEIFSHAFRGTFKTLPLTGIFESHKGKLFNDVLPCLLIEPFYLILTNDYFYGNEILTNG